MKIFQFLLFSALCGNAAIAEAQTPVLVHNFSPGAWSGNPRRLTVFSGRLALIATDGICPSSTAHGNELYAVSTSGAAVRYEVTPGCQDGANGMQDDHRTMVELGGNLYFPGSTPSTGIELFRWDGLGSPTLVADVRPGPSGSAVGEIVTLGGKLYFDAGTTSAGRELHCYDPTTGSTALVVDLWPGTTDSYPENLTVFAGKLYFQARTSASGFELFCYDPVAATTMLVADINLGSDGSYPTALTVESGRLYFIASQSIGTTQLHYYTPSTGVVACTAIGNGEHVQGGHKKQPAIGVLNGKLYFATSDTLISQRLYQYDPATSTTTLVKVIHTEPSTSYYSPTPSFITYANKLYFSADNGTQGNELWSYDGVNSPVIVADLAPGYDGSDPINMTIFNGELYFQAYTDDVGTELYKLSNSGGSTGIDVSASDAANNDFSIHPNPASDAVVVRSTFSGMFELTDAVGRNILRTAVHSGSNYLSVAALPKGIYTATLHGPNAYRTSATLVLQ